MENHVWIRGERYLYSGTHDSFENAKESAKKRGKRYFIIEEDNGFIVTEMKYHLYIK